MDKNIKKFEPQFDSIYEVNRLLEGKDIDLRKTIKKVLSKDIGIDHDMIVDIEDYDLDLSKLNTGSDDYYNKLEELKNEGKWIYIHSIYATDEIGGNSEDIYRYNPEDYSNDDDNDYVTVGVDSCVCNCDLIINSDYYCGELTGDYGIMIEGNEISFSQYIGGFASGIDPILDLSEPLNALAVEILLDIVEFKE